MFVNLKGLVLLSAIGIAFISTQNIEVGESSKGVVSGNNTAEITESSRNKQLPLY